MQDTLRALIKDYCATLARQMEEIAGHLENMRSGTDALMPLRAALDPVHQISGLSGTMGYRPISECSMELETFMRRFDENDQTPAVTDLAIMDTLFETLSQHAAAVEPENSTLYHVDLGALAAGIR